MYYLLFALPIIRVYFYRSASVFDKITTSCHQKHAGLAAIDSRKTASASSKCIDERLYNDCRYKLVWNNLNSLLDDRRAMKGIHAITLIWCIVCACVWCVCVCEGGREGGRVRTDGLLNHWLDLTLHLPGSSVHQPHTWTASVTLIAVLHVASCKQSTNTF